MTSVLERTWTETSAECAHPVRFKSLLVATDGGRECDDALVLARAIAERHGATVQVASICEEMFGDLARDPLSPPLPRGTEAAAREGRLENVRGQVVRCVGNAAAWPVVVAPGPFSEQLESLVHASGADLVLTGRGRHGAISRFLNEEHAVRALRALSVPVLAVSDAHRTLPARIVIATDFSHHSVRAARTALAILADRGSVYLVHAIGAPGINVAAGDEWTGERETVVRAELARLAAELMIPEEVTVECAIVTGYPPIAVAEYADALRADLLVVGAHGKGFVQRAIVGSVTTHAIRHTRASVLAVPPGEAQNGGVQAPTLSIASVPRAEWDSVLRDYETSHTGARVRIATARIGGRAPGVIAGPFLGFADDPRGYVADVSLAGGARGERLFEIVAVTVNRNHRGDLVALDVEHGRGVTRIEPVR